MAPWIQYLLALAALVVLAPLVAWAARRFGAKARGGLMMASMLLGFGAVVDPPTKHAIEAAEPAKGSSDNDEPPLA